MGLLTNFFKESDTQLGVFYPNHYLIAVFRNLEYRAATGTLSGSCDSRDSPRMR